MSGGVPDDDVLRLEEDATAAAASEGDNDDDDPENDGAILFGGDGEDRDDGDGDEEEEEEEEEQEEEEEEEEEDKELLRVRLWSLLRLLPRLPRCVVVVLETPRDALPLWWWSASTSMGPCACSSWCGQRDLHCSRRCRDTYTCMHAHWICK